METHHTLLLIICYLLGVKFDYINTEFVACIKEKVGVKLCLKEVWGGWRKKTNIFFGFSVTC